MPSRQLFINSYGFDRILGSIWVGCFIPRQPVNFIQPISCSNIEVRFEFMFKQITPANLSRSIPPQVLMAKAARYMIGVMQVQNIETKLDIYNCCSYALGSLGGSLPQLKPTAKISRLTLEACKLAWAKEMERLQKHYPNAPLLKLTATNHKAVGLNILENGPTFGVRYIYLKRIPLVWLDLLRLGHPSCNLDYFIKPPAWWVETFGVPWYHFLEAIEINEAIHLISLQQPNFVTPTAVLKIARAKAGSLTLPANHDILLI